MKVSAALVRYFTRFVPVPGRYVRRWLDKNADRIKYPNLPTVVGVHGGGKIQIRSLQEYIQRNIYFLGYYEAQETLLLRTLLRPGDTFVDVGANIGWFTLKASRRVGAKGRVIAFEPSKRIYTHLETTVAINGLANVRLENCAVSSESGTATLSGVAEHNEGIGSIAGSSSESSFGKLFPSETVPTVSLDSYFAEAETKRIRMLKVDVEGAEHKVLEGMPSLLRERRFEHILIEISDERLRQVGQSGEAVFDRLRNAGYSLNKFSFGRLAPAGGIAEGQTVNLLASCCW